MRASEGTTRTHLCVAELGHVGVRPNPAGEVEGEAAGRDLEDQHDAGQDPILAIAHDEDAPPAGTASQPCTTDGEGEVDAREEALGEEHVEARHARVDDELWRKEGEDVRVGEGLDRVQPRPRAVVDRVAERREGEEPDEELEGEPVGRAEAQKVDNGCGSRGSGQPRAGGGKEGERDAPM